MGKILKILICVVVVSSLFFFLYLEFSGEEREQVSVDVVSEESLQTISQFKNRTIRAGYMKGYEKIFSETVIGAVKEIFSIDFEPIEYDNMEQLNNDLIHGEIDILIDHTNSNDSGELYSTTARIASSNTIITNVDNPMYDIDNMKDKKIGFLNNSKLYQNATTLLGEEFEAYYFETIPEALEALEDENIDAVITREYNRQELMARNNLQIEFSFQEELVPIRFATAKEDLFAFIEGMSEYLTIANRLDAEKSIFLLSNEYFMEDIAAYLQEEYQFVIEKYKNIDVGMHNTTFPYSYFEEDGTATGIYVEMLEFFENITGIQYEIQNSASDINFTNLLDDLSTNDLDLLIGVIDEAGVENVVSVGESVTDPIISIVRTGEEKVGETDLGNLHFGTVKTLKESISHILEYHYYTEFENYEEAVVALLNGDIDVFIGRNSMLLHYQNILGNVSINQFDLINKPSTHGILGNSNNEDLNSLIEEVQRLFYILNIGDLENQWEKQTINYQFEYERLLDAQTTTRISLILLAVFLVISIITVIIMRGKRERARLKRLNEVDALTGLYNRNSYKEKCMELIEKYSNTLGIFFFIDLNDFKGINDTYGHAVGDRVLSHFGNMVNRLKDKNTIAFRIAGDEFGLFSMGYQTRYEIEEVIQEIKKSMEGETFVGGELSLPIKLSAGGSIYHIDTTDFDTMVEYADFAMYRAKEKKNDSDANVTIELFDREVFDNSNKESLKTHALDTVLKEKQVYGVYQPICYLDNEKVYGYEGLSRTSNPAFSNILELIKVASEKERIGELDLLMMEQLLRGFNREGKLFINVEAKSPEAIVEYMEKMIHTAKEVDISTNHIILELSEREQWSQAGLSKIKEYVKKYQFILAIDDFGVGFSNASLVLKLQPDIVKIDRSFVQGIHNEKTNYSYIKFFIEFARSNQVKIVSEGIELEEELDVLKSLGSDYGQGYYLGKPI